MKKTPPSRILLLGALGGSLFAATPKALAANWYVSPTGSNSAAGTSASPLKTIAYALGTKAQAGDTVYLMDGTFAEGNLVISKPISLLNATGAAPKIQSPTDSLHRPSLSINLSSAANLVTIRGIRFMDGILNSGVGGAVTLSATTSANFLSCVFTGYQNPSGNGGAVVNNGTATFQNCTFNGNSTTNRGGAIYSTGSTSVVGSTFNQNQSGEGGAIYGGAGGTLTCLASTFDTNSCTGGGGAISNAGTMAATNCQFTNNTGYHGGAVSTSTAIQVSFCTFTLNKSSSYSGALDGDIGGNTRVSNSILWGDSPNETSTNMTFKFSDVPKGIGGLDSTDFSTDPLFKDPVHGNFQLQTGSPCIGAALPSPTITTDITGRARYAKTAMGAFESPFWTAMSHADDGSGAIRILWTLSSGAFRISPVGGTGISTACAGKNAYLLAIAPNGDSYVLLEDTKGNFMIWDVKAGAPTQIFSAAVPANAKPQSLSVRSDGKITALWLNPFGQAQMWIINPTGGGYSTVTYLAPN